MSKEILYTDVNNQIEKLKQQGLIIDNLNFAKTELQCYGYSNLIKSYRDPYTIMSDGKKIYRSGITFEQIWSLFILDKNLRYAVMGSMLDLEERVKEAAADTIAGAFGILESDYLQFRNYQNRKTNAYRFSLGGILDSLKKTLQTNKNPIYHYAQKYNNVPPWILFKSIYFSTLVNYIALFKKSEQHVLVSKLYNPTELGLSIDDLTPIMLDSLFIFLEYRNLAAHGGRIYNYSSDKRLRLPNNASSQVHGFSQLLYLLNIMDYPGPFRHMKKVLEAELSRHCSLFPEDVTYLSQILQVDITESHPVWISPQSGKYHYDNHCCGMKNPLRFELREAKAKGFLPCKRCVNSQDTLI